ncbi:MAG: HipA domain-containing protein [Bacteroidia bacterium]|nr:HipA domain-containing protein [Bacteroidia bacterium]
MPGLRKEVSKEMSGSINAGRKIPELKPKNYRVLDIGLDGDAPKQFIKAYFYEQKSGKRQKNTRSWPAYIAKTAEKWYPHESVIEFMINRIGQEMGVNMNDIRLVHANGQIRFLSKFFLRKNERLIHGAEICGAYLNDNELAKEIALNRKTAREFFTFEFISRSIKTVFPLRYDHILNELVKMIAFDALVGNNDRHFYNWGVIDSTLTGSYPAKFAPVYDSARGLLWNLSDENIRKHYHSGKNRSTFISKYINTAAPRISIEGNTGINHFELINYLKKENKDYEEIVFTFSSKETEQKVFAMLETEFFDFFIPERNALVTEILVERFKKIREASLC